jgi:hypothetical protein
VINLVHLFDVLHAPMDDVSCEFYAFFLELRNEGEKSEPIIRGEGVVDELDIAVLPQSLEGFYVGLQLGVGDGRVMGNLAVYLLGHF